MKHPLFKFRKIDGNTKDSILNNYLYFNDVKEFNDPFDCIIKMKYSGGNRDFETFLTKQLNKELSSKELKEWIDKLRKRKYSILQERDFTSEVFRLCCLTESNNNILMWSHYGDSHKGICIEYDFEIDQTTGRNIYTIKADEGQVIYPQKYNYLPALDVQYVEQLPKSHNPLIDEQIKIIEFYYKKHIDWKYEKEKRIVLKTDYIKGNKVKLTNNAIIGLYFGLKAKEEDILEIIELFDVSQMRKPKMFRAELSNTRDYEIQFKEILEA